MEPLEAMILPWAQGVVSSNLAAPTNISNNLIGTISYRSCLVIGAVSYLPTRAAVHSRECRLPKLKAGVRVPSRAPSFFQGVALRKAWLPRILRFWHELAQRISR